MDNKFKYKALRTGRTALAIAVLGLLTGGIVFGFGTFAARVQFMPAVLGLSVVAVAVWVAVTLLLGRIYCSTFCPIGTLSDATARAGMALHRLRLRRAGRPTADVGYRYRRPLNITRGTVLLIAVGLVLVGLPVFVNYLDPYDTFRRPLLFATAPAAVGAIAVVAAWLFLAVVLLPALRRGRLVCNTVCPVGALLGMMSRVSIYHPNINTDLCIGCGECQRVCKSECIDPQSHTIDLSRCVVCFDCMDSCPNQAITYRRGFHQLKNPMLQTTTKANIEKT